MINDFGLAEWAERGQTFLFYLNINNKKTWAF